MYFKINSDRESPEGRSVLMKGRNMEHIVIVDENDNIIGEEDKEKCHDGDGILHRAFLVTVFNRKGELLLARRSDKKRLWPGVWDGTVASHVTKEENYVQASQRRLEQEVGLTADHIEYLFKFHYKAGYEDKGTEHEICAVTKVDNVDIERLVPNRDEISNVISINPHELMEELQNRGNRFTPWLKLALENLNKHKML